MNVEKIKKYIQVILFTQIGIIPAIILTIIFLNLPWIDKEAFKNVNKILLTAYIVAGIYGVWLNHRGFTIDTITCKKNKKLDAIMLLITFGYNAFIILFIIIISAIQINLSWVTKELIYSRCEIEYASLLTVNMIDFPLCIYISRIRSDEW